MGPVNVLGATRSTPGHPGADQRRRSLVWQTPPKQAAAAEQWLPLATPKDLGTERCRSRELAEK